MPPLRAVAILLALALCGVEAAVLATRAAPGVVVAPSDTRVAAEVVAPAPPGAAPASGEGAPSTVDGAPATAAAPDAVSADGRPPTAAAPDEAPADGAPSTATLEPAFLAHMTADDVARGVYGLAAAEGAVALTEEQRRAIAPLLTEGAALRARLGELRMTRRAAREAWLAGGAEMVAVVGPARARVAAGAPRAPAPGAGAP